MFKFLYFGVIAAEEGGKGSLIEPNVGVIFWTVITFILLLLILKKFAWKPILSALDTRENAIEDALRQADKARAEAKAMMADNEKIIASAHVEANKIIQQSKEYAEKLKDDLVQKAKEEEARIKENAIKEIERKNSEEFSKLKAQVAAIAVDAAEKILKENIDKEKNNKLVNNFLSEIKSN